MNLSRKYINGNENARNVCVRIFGGCSASQKIKLVRKLSNTIGADIQ